MTVPNMTTSSPKEANPLEARELYNDPEFAKLSIKERNKIYFDRVHASAKSSKSTIILLNKPDCEVTTPQGVNCTLSEYGSQVSRGDGVFWIPEGSTLTIHSPTACNMALDPAGDKTLEQNPGLTVQNAKPATVEDAPEDDNHKNDPLAAEDVKVGHNARGVTSSNTTTINSNSGPLCAAPPLSITVKPVTALELMIGKNRPPLYFDDFMAINGRFFPEHKVLLNKDINVYLLRPVIANGMTILVHAQVLAMYFPALDDTQSVPSLHIARHFDGVTTAALILAFYHVDRQDISMDHLVSSGKLRDLFYLWVHWNPQMNKELVQEVWEAVNQWVCRL